MTVRHLTPSQTIGPFFAHALTPAGDGYAPLIAADLLTADTVGEPIRIVGRILDGAGQVVPDAMVEIWQADAAGRYPGGATSARPNSGFRGFGRAACDSAGEFAFRTVKPGAVPGPAGPLQAPHIDVGIFARGLLRRLFTRIYFPDEPANQADPILALVAPDRRATLIARRDASADGALRYRFDITLQGAQETVFFEA
jgi:protocatechuate 3,4-dioxygenase alpha subunit